MWLALLALFGFGAWAVGSQVSSGNETPTPAPPSPQNNVDAWTRFDSLFKKYGAIYGVKWTWLKAIALNESNLGRERSVALGISNPSDVNGSKSSDGKSWGLMQVTLTTARGLDPLATEAKLNNPEYSIKLAAQYLGKTLMPRFPMVETRYTEWVIKSYNQGPGNTDKERKGGPGYANEYWARFQRNLERAEA